MNLKIYSYMISQDHMSLVKITGLSEHIVLDFLFSNYGFNKIPFDNLEAYAKYTGKLPDPRLAQMMTRVDLTNVIHLF